MIVCFLVFSSSLSLAQKGTVAEKCGTMSVLEKYFRETPGARERYENNLKAAGSANNTTNRTNDITTIPVVVHIVLPNPYQISDADVQSVIDKWNIDFSGLNADSTNGVNFYNVRGHSEIRFALAKRTPTNTTTNGVERRFSSTGLTGGNPDPIKRTAQGGLDAWNSNDYLNIWVGADNSGQGLLGYATFPGTQTAADQGVVINYASFSLNPCYTISQYNLGRTTAHEIGHYLGLYHIWGDETGCTGDDFRQLPGTVLLPSGLFNPPGQGNTTSDIGDTPNQAGSTTNCPTGTVTDACSSTAPGKMYQNYMDYTADGCYSMFTNKQVARMQWVIDNARAGLKTSLALTPPSGAVLLDAAIVQTVSPGGSEYIGCNLVSYPSTFASCTGGSATVSPKVRIQNNGVTTITSVTVSYTVNGNPGGTQTFTGLNILTGYSTVVTFTTPFNLTTAGTYNFAYTVSAPNGGVDQVATNNSSTGTFTLSTLTPVSAPVAEGFEGAFPPTNWTLTQVSGTGNWAKNTAAFKTGTASAKFDNYTYNAGVSSSLTSPNINFASSATNASLTFHYAHQSYTAAPNNEPDKLEVFISTNCGATWTSLWVRQGSQLITATPANATGAFTPTAAQWTQTPITIDLTSYRTQTIQVRFTATSGYGNNLYLDDINIQGFVVVNNDAGVTAINTPTTQICSSAFTPQVVVRNNGSNAITSLQVGYRVDNNTPIANQSFTGLNIAAGASTTLTLNAYTGPALAVGAHTIRAYTSLPNGVVDPQQSNDSLTKAFTIVSSIPLPVVEGFEGTTFPPPGWRIINPDGATTWIRSTAAAKSGTGSAYINLFNYATIGQTDWLVSPSVNFAGFSGGSLSFDYAYRPYSAGFSDSLTVLVSSDCGTTWTTVWQKFGLALASDGGGYLTTNFVPTAAQWTSTPVKIDLTSYIGSGNIFVAFRSGNRYGNNIYLDNINIAGVYNYDVQMSSVIKPVNEECSAPLTPTVKVTNNGTITTTSLKIGYQLDGGAQVTTTFSNLNIARDKDTTLNLTPINTLAFGAHTFRVFTFEPNGQNDQNKVNDTLNTGFTLLTNVALPLKEGFETTTFPPANWQIAQTPVDPTTWTRISSPQIVASEGLSAARMRNFNYTTTGRLDNLVSPVLVVPSSYDSLALKFDVAHISRQYPGSTSVPLDTLEVEMTKDCGKTWVSLYKKWGADLQTISQPNTSYLDSFIVNNKNQWRTDSVKLNGLVSANDVIRLRFKNTNNNGNNLYLDNINLSTKTLPNTLKTNGLLLSPNPVQNTLTVQHYLAPTNLRGIGVYNSVGQRLAYTSYGGNADSYIAIDMSRFAAGIYTIKLEYTNKTVAQRVMKL